MAPFELSHQGKRRPIELLAAEAKAALESRPARLAGESVADHEARVAEWQQDVHGYKRRVAAADPGTRRAFLTPRERAELPAAIRQEEVDAAHRAKDREARAAEEERMRHLAEERENTKWWKSLTDEERAVHLAAQHQLDVERQVGEYNATSDEAIAARNRQAQIAKLHNRL